MNNRGAAAEARAAHYLEARGLQIVARNYRSRYGEIDLIAQDGAMLVFVEVRARKSSVFGGAAASITPAKQQKITRTAWHYLATLGHTPPCRFDAVLLTNNASTIEWVRDAFSAA